jgi:hypothetical protein
VINLSEDVSTCHGRHLRSYAHHTACAPTMTRTSRPVAADQSRDLGPGQLREVLIDDQGV